MNYLKLEQSGVLFLTIQKIAEILSISEVSARVLAVRYVKKKLFVRVRKNFYVLAVKLNLFERNELFYLSNLIQTPSYVSFFSALSYYQLTTQITRGLIEAVNPVRSVAYSAGGIDFIYRKMKKEFYFGFERVGNFFIASPEKAFFDCCWFAYLNKYSVDWDSLDWNRIDKQKINEIVKIAGKNMGNKSLGDVRRFISNLYSQYARFKET